MSTPKRTSSHTGVVDAQTYLRRDGVAARQTLLRSSVFKLLYLLAQTPCVDLTRLNEEAQALTWLADCR